MDIAKALKDEIARISRKETRALTDALKDASTRHRRELASLKRQLAEIESAPRGLSKTSSARALKPHPAAGPAESTGRFSAKGFAAHRIRLSLSAAEMASLVGVSARSIYHWEQGKSRPRASQMPAIGVVRKMGKREAAYRLSVLEY
jgi:DNA-binding transcriptional regulator YiaG